MRPDLGSLRQSRGFGLVAALFLIIVVALVVTAMARLSSTQHGTNNLALQQARAYQAARAGLEWGIDRAVAGNCAAGPVAVAVNGAGSALGEFSPVQVTCIAFQYTENGATRVLRRVTATAQNGAPGARPDFAFRQLTATVE